MSEVWILTMLVLSTSTGTGGEWISPHTYPTEALCEKVGFAVVALAHMQHPSHQMLFTCTKETRP